MKRLFIVIASISILIAAVILFFLAKDFIPIVIAVAVVILGFYALWRPPKKHKEFSLHDRDEATIRTFGGSGIPDLSELEPNEKETKRKKHSQDKFLKH
jgi:uncharacterized membrane protein YfcA